MFATSSVLLESKLTALLLVGQCTLPFQRAVDVIICYLVKHIAHLRGMERYVFSIGTEMISGEVRQTFLPVSFGHYVIVRIMMWL